MAAIFLLPNDPAFERIYFKTSVVSIYSGSHPLHRKPYLTAKPESGPKQTPPVRLHEGETYKYDIFI
jgi:hypothetical protein